MSQLSSRRLFAVEQINTVITEQDTNPSDTPAPTNVRQKRRSREPTAYNTSFTADNGDKDPVHRRVQICTAHPVFVPLLHSWGIPSAIAIAAAIATVIVAAVVILTTIVISYRHYYHHYRR